MKCARKIWALLISLKFAIIVIVVLLAALIVATSLESIYDTPSAQYHVYRAAWFFGLLFLFGLNILCVALSRLPWQKRHLPFLVAHLGLLLVLYGSFLTQKFGLDGMLRLEPGRDTATVELSDADFVIAKESDIERFVIPWLPPHVKFSPIELPKYGIRIVEYLAHADAKVLFKASGATGLPALEFEVKGGPAAPMAMRMGQKVWVYLGAPDYQNIELGPLQVRFLHPEVMLKKPEAGRPPMPFLVIRPDRAHQKISLEFITRAGIRSRVVLPYRVPADLVGKTVVTPFLSGVNLKILNWLPYAEPQVEYGASYRQYGPGLPGPAIRVVNAAGDSVWLGLDEKAEMEYRKEKFSISFNAKKLILPVTLRLEKFGIVQYPGSEQPQSFFSELRVSDRSGTRAVKIEMNEPLKQAGYTFYQSSYDAMGEGKTASILSVNQDPGRWVKYLGSLLVVLGTLWLFLSRKLSRGTG